MLGGGRLRDVGEIAAIHAEDHYVRVFPRDGGDFIVTARFRDAVDVLATIRGCQTHRSWWVNAADVRHVDCHRRDPVIELSTGLTVPVSQSYKQLLRRAGMLPPA